MDPSMKLFEYDEKSLLASIPTMLAFPKVWPPYDVIFIINAHGSCKLHDVYQAWREEIASRGNVEFKLNHPVLQVLSRTAKKDGPVRIQYHVSDGDLQTEPQIAVFDELKFALNALPETLINMLQSLVSLRRIEKYLNGA